MLKMALEAKSSLLSKHDAPSRPPTSLEQTFGDPELPILPAAGSAGDLDQADPRRGRHEISSACGLGQCSGALLHIPANFRFSRKP
jgi:hypothetical protein